MCYNFSMEIQYFEQLLKNRYGSKVRLAGGKSPQVKKILDIASNKKPNPAGHIIVEGIWANNLALKHHISFVYTLVCSDEVLSPEAERCVFEVAERSKSIYLISKKTLESVAEQANSAGIVSVCVFPEKELSQLNPADTPLLVVLDGLEIPGNVGTLVRSADGTDAAVAITNRKTRLTHPKFIRSSQGSCFRVPIVETTAEDLIPWLDAAGYDIVLADTDASVPYYSYEFRKKTALILGSERYGISAPYYEYAKRHAVHIPMFGDCDSLNVGIAGTVLLYEASLQIKGMLKRGK